LEKSEELYVLPVDLAWADIGHWQSVYDLLKGESNAENVVRNAKYVCVDSRDNLIFSETDQLISTVGIHNTLVIVSADAILICSKDQSQKVKYVVAKLQSIDEFKNYL